MQPEKRINAFLELGKFLRSGGDPSMQSMMEQAYLFNNWFTLDNTNSALKAIGNMLNEHDLNAWASNYDLTNNNHKNIGCIMAGNIPAVGFHDFLCILISGNKLIAKLSSDDKLILPWIAEKLIAIEPEFKERIKFTTQRIDAIDAVIATGSNNSSTYFEHYFGKYPHIIRKNRNSIAVLDGTETKEQLEALGNDVFLYFGLGCRNVSKLFVPKGYDLDKFFGAIFEFKDVINHTKYGNNYDYNKTIYLMGSEPLLENGFLLLKQDIGMSSPVAVMFYEYYESPEVLSDRLLMDKNHIQCIVGKKELHPQAIPFGTSQTPGLADYADGIDTLDFLLKLK